MKRYLLLVPLCILGVAFYVSNAKAYGYVHEQQSDPSGHVIVGPGTITTDITPFNASMNVATGTPILVNLTVSPQMYATCGEVFCSEIGINLVETTSHRPVAGDSSSMLRNIESTDYQNHTVAMTTFSGIRSGESYALQFSGPGGFIIWLQTNTAMNDFFGYVYVNSLTQGQPQITYPQNNTTVSGYPWFTMYGTCSADVDLSLYDGMSYASSTYAIGQSQICNAAEWSWSIPSLEQGYYSLVASSTTGLQGIVFYYLAQSVVSGGGLGTTTPTSTLAIPDATITLNWSCQIEWFLGSWNPCSVIGTIVQNSVNGSLRSLSGLIRGIAQHTRPFSYVPEVGAKIITSMMNATATSPIATVPVTYHLGLGETGIATTTVNVQAFATTTLTTIPSSTRTTMRNLSSLMFTAAALVYLILKAKAFV